MTGVLVAILVTATMDATGLSDFSALPLFPIAGAFWALQRLPRAAVGLRTGRWTHYGLALLHPAFVIGALTSLASASGRLGAGDADWGSTGTKIFVNSLAGALVVLLTEEGFFRGWLWGSLRRSGLTEGGALAWSSLAFAAWHVSPVVFETSFRPPGPQVPVFLSNVLVLGVIWGLLRSISGSVVVAAFCHAVWNAVAYALYGFGTKTGALGISDTSWFAPETGLLGLALNVAFGAALFALWWRSSQRVSAS